jgi:hypothetical protein
MSEPDLDRALQILNGMLETPVPELPKPETPVPRRWQPGAWLHDETPQPDALAGLDPFLGYPGGGNAALWLPGWDQRSVWGFDPPADCYFALLWANSSHSQSDKPDIWIFGRGTLDGREYVVTTTHLLAEEIAAATGCALDTVAAALASSSFG